MLRPATVELSLLFRSQWERVRLLGDAVPDVFDELQALCDAQIAIVEFGLGHGTNLETKHEWRKMCAHPPRQDEGLHRKEGIGTV